MMYYEFGDIKFGV